MNETEEAQISREPEQKKHLDKKFWLPVLVLAALLFSYLAIASEYGLWPFGVSDERSEIKDEKNEICIQVITPARNPETGEVEEFPTPCDVPDGWEVLAPDKINE